MPSMKQIFGAVVAALAVVNAAPAIEKRVEGRALAMWENHLNARQNPATGLPDGLGDVDILQL